MGGTSPSHAHVYWQHAHCGASHTLGATDVGADGRVEFAAVGTNKACAVL